MKLCLCSPEITNEVTVGEICMGVDDPHKGPHILQFLTFYTAVTVVSKQCFSCSMAGPHTRPCPGLLGSSDRKKFETQGVLASWPVLFLTSILFLISDKWEMIFVFPQKRRQICIWNPMPGLWPCDGLSHKHGLWIFSEDP